jgi:hypothetical protein
VICARVFQGCVKHIKNSGWLHLLGDQKSGRQTAFRRAFRSSAKTASAAIDFSELAQRFESQLTTDKLEQLSRILSITAISLRRLRTGWATADQLKELGTSCRGPGAFSFPMVSTASVVVGIRLRTSDGFKYAVTGSRQGLFIPAALPADGPLLVTEGPSDLCVALDLGFAAIGRPSCNALVTETAKSVRGRDVVIVADTDEPGKLGAERLARRLALVCSSLKIVLPPTEHKDLRKWEQAGLTGEQLGKIIAETKPIKINLHFEIRKKQR